MTHPFIYACDFEFILKRFSRRTCTSGPRKAFDNLFAKVGGKKGKEHAATDLSLLILLHGAAPPAPASACILDRSYSILENIFYTLTGQRRALETAPSIRAQPRGHTICLTDKVHTTNMGFVSKSDLNDEMNGGITSMFDLSSGNH